MGSSISRVDLSFLKVDFSPPFQRNAPDFFPYYTRRDMQIVRKLIFFLKKDGFT